MNGIFDLGGPLLHSIPETVYLKEAKKKMKKRKVKYIKTLMTVTELYNSKSEEDLNATL